MPDFTLHTFHRLLSTLKEQQYVFRTFSGFIENPAIKCVILRHDVDRLPENSVVTAGIEKEIGITGTYYFRAGKQGFDNEAITKIARLGHEIGYHYEDLSLAALRRRGERERGRSERSGDSAKRKGEGESSPEEEGLAKIAIDSFRENLQKLRELAPVRTICMHGSPLSRWDNRLLWKYYDYRDYGIIGEPYLDINFDEVLYLTDTGRRWDGDSVNIRDKAQGKKRGGEGERGRVGEKTTSASDFPPSPLPPFSPSSKRFHSTNDIITAAKIGTLPNKVMLTVHPQRWDNHPLPWLRELVWQNVKNLGKWFLNR